MSKNGTKLNSTSTSVRSSGGTSIRSQDVRLSCNLHAWQRIQSLVKGVETSNQKLQKLKDELDSDEVSHLLEAHSIASEISNLQVLNEIRTTRIDRLKRICARKRLKIAQLQDEQEKKEQEMVEIKQRSDKIDTIYVFAMINLQEKQKYAYAYSRLVRHRIRVLLKELKDVIKIELRDAGPANCPCKRVDFICGVHLPPVNSLKGHIELEFTAALGYLVHLMKCIGQILDYNYRYPMVEAASTSQIYSPSEEKALPLFGTHWRADRERLDSALTLLGKNIAQLRCDTGLSSPDFFHFLQLIREWLEVVIRGKGDVKFLDRPWKRNGTPAMLLDDLDETAVGVFLAPEKEISSREKLNGLLSVSAENLSIADLSALSFEDLNNLQD